MSEKYDNSGAISKNERKEKPSHADYSGSALIDGTEFWVNGWVKERSDGSGKFLSLSFRPKETRDEPVGSVEAEDFF